MLRTLQVPDQQEILGLLSQGLIAGNVSNPSGFVVKKVMGVTPKGAIGWTGVPQDVSPAAQLLWQDAGPIVGGTMPSFDFGGLPRYRATPY